MSVDRPTRVAALGLHHETNTFSSFATTYESFSTSSYGGLLRGAQIEEHQRPRTRPLPAIPGRRRIRLRPRAAALRGQRTCYGNADHGTVCSSTR